MAVTVSDEPAPAAEGITDLLVAWSGGDPAAADEVIPRLYPRLHRIAERCLGGERPDHTLQPTALVHEAYLRLAAQNRTRWANGSQFLALAATMMRRVLVDYARGELRGKRGSRPLRRPLQGAAGEVADPRGERWWDLLALDAALRRLAAIDPRKVEVVEIHFLAGLSVEETACALGCSAATVSRDWRLAKAWLSRELGAAAGDGR